MEQAAVAPTKSWQLTFQFVFGLMAGLVAGWIWLGMILSVHVLYWYEVQVKNSRSEYYKPLIEVLLQFSPLDTPAENWGFRVTCVLYVLAFVSLFV